MIFVMARTDSDPVRKVLLVGLGVALMTREGVERFVSKVQREYNLNEGDARKLVNDIVKEAKRKESKVRAMLKKKAKPAKPAPKKKARKRGKKK